MTPNTKNHIYQKAELTKEEDINIWELCSCLNIDLEGGSYSYTKYRYARKVVLFTQRLCTLLLLTPLFLLLNTLRLLLPLVADDLMMMSLHSFQLSPHNH